MVAAAGGMRGKHGFLGGKGRSRTESAGASDCVCICGTESVGACWWSMRACDDGALNSAQRRDQPMPWPMSKSWSGMGSVLCESLGLPGDAPNWPGF